MSRTPSRSSPLLAEEELRLPRAPGVIRRFWARHPVLADVLIVVICLFLSAAPATVFRTTYTNGVTVSETTLITSNIALTVALLIACGLLLRRRSWPVTAFIASSAVSAAYLLTGVPTGPPLGLVTSYSLAVYRSTRAAWIGFAASTAAFSLLAALLAAAGIVPFQTALNFVLSELIGTLIGTLVGANVGGRKRYLEAIIDRSRQLLVERDQQGQIAAAAERSRIAREMHDIVSHSLTVVVALSEGAAATPDPDRARAASTAAAATARDALTEMRSMLGVLREGDADAPLAPAEPVSPDATVLAAQRAGFPVVLTTRGDAASAPAVDYAIGRIVQEGVTNAMRHAPGATAISVRIDRAADGVVVEIGNDGAVPSSDAGGFGLRGLAERAAHVGGSLTAGPDGPGRWRLRARLPMSPGDAGASADERSDAP
ncbi:sensor histidine kinase [Microbacterium tumbae]